MIDTFAPFDSLRMIFSTGSVLTAQQFEWTQLAFNPTVHIASSSGGTDICGGCKSVLKYLGLIEINGFSCDMCRDVAGSRGRYDNNNDRFCCNI